MYFFLALVTFAAAYIAFDVLAWSMTPQPFITR